MHHTEEKLTQHYENNLLCQTNTKTTYYYQLSDKYGKFVCLFHLKTKVSEWSTQASPCVVCHSLANKKAHDSQ